MIDRLPQMIQLCDPEYLNSSDPQVASSQAYLDDQRIQGIDDEFFERIKTVREMVINLRNNNDRIQNLKNKYARAIKSAQQKANSQQMEQILSKNTQIYTKIKDHLLFIKSSVQEAQQNHPDEPETRMKRNFQISVSKEAFQVLRMQQSQQEQYKNTVKDKVIRQVRLIDRQVTDQQLLELVQDPQLAQKKLETKILGQPSSTLRNAVSDIQDKVRDIKRLEKSVQKCLQLFNQLSALVQAQGQMIDNIADNVHQTKDYVERGQQNLVQAKQHHKFSKKCMIITIIAAVVLLIIIIGVIVIIATSASK